MNLKQFEKFISDTLKGVELYKPEAVNLILGTSAQESGFCEFIYQLGNGPALSFFQMEPNTFNDIRDHYLAYHPKLKRKIFNYCNITKLESDLLLYNLRVAVIFCRLQYYRRPEKLPTNITGMAAYWKKFYNTSKGKGTKAEFISNYKKYILKNKK